MTEYALNIGWLYPKLMSTYGDRGNVICLKQRALWRGIDITITPLDRESGVEAFEDVDTIVGGGAQDRQQEIVMRDLKGIKAQALKDKIEAGTPGVFTCGSPQLLGHYYEPALGEQIKGLGLLDLYSKHPGFNASRCIGNVVFEVTATKLATELQAELGESPIILGFENHGGRTYLGKVSPLGRVLKGFGNNGEDKTEGAFYQNAIATYSHGPLLPKNPFIADWLLQTALKNKYAQTVPLTKLDDSLATQARHALFRRLELANLIKSA
ncbi:MAG: type 1 glutamine amidotransferase [Cyanobacteria bacterium P01_H01_bin.15]